MFYRTSAVGYLFGDAAMREYRDASGRLSIDLTADGQMFQIFASRIEGRCGGRRVQQLDGLDQSYWDYDVEGTTVVIHSDTFAGISLHVADGSRDDLLRRVAVQITEPDGSANRSQPSGRGTNRTPPDRV
jgi:hypothetical protein